jgi:hypothetical protein
MDDPSAKDVPQEKKDYVIREVMKLIDQNSNGVIEREEWMQFAGEDRKGTLPDFGLGPGKPAGENMRILSNTESPFTDSTFSTRTSLGYGDGV